MTTLQGRAVIVTGAGSGLGAAYAIAAAAAGASVVCADIDGAAAGRITETIVQTGGAATAVKVDVGDWTDAAALVEACVERYGAVDGLVNNAGVVTVAGIAEETERNLRRVIEVNLLGSAFCGIHALRHMTARGEGSIVNVTSGSALGVARLGAYSASKGGVTALTYAWAAEVAGTGIRVNAVSPNARTPLADTLALAFPEIPVGSESPQSNAAAVVHLLSDDARDIHGQVFVTGGPTLSRQSRPRITELAGRETWTQADVASAMSGRPL